MFSDITKSVTDLFNLLWGWIVAGGLIRIAVEVGKFLLFYYAKKQLDSGEPQKLAIRAKHFLHNHPGFLPYKCEEGLCVRFPNDN